jgi:hypothetical protein
MLRGFGYSSVADQQFAWHAVFWRVEQEENAPFLVAATKRQNGFGFPGILFRPIGWELRKARYLIHTVPFARNRGERFHIRRRPVRQELRRKQ